MSRRPTMKWDEKGDPMNLEAAAADALLWLDVLQLMHRRGRAKFELAGSAKQLQGAREALERFLSVGKKREAK